MILQYEDSPDSRRKRKTSIRPSKVGGQKSNESRNALFVHSSQIIYTSDPHSYWCYLGKIFFQEGSVNLQSFVLILL